MVKRQWSSLKIRNLLVFALIAQACIYWIWRWDGFQLRASGPRIIGDMDEGAYGETPPDIKAKISGYVQEVTWDPEFPWSTCKLAKSFNGRSGEPILIRNAIDWPALQLWNLTWLAHQDIEVDVWAAPNMRFYYINENLLHREMEKDSSRSLPVAHKPMKAQEAVARMQRKSTHLPIHFRDTERYYLRFDVPDSMNKSLGPHSGALSCFLKKDFQGDEGLDHFLAERQSEPFRVWVSPKGAISPLHYDSAPSFLIQVHGVKRMLLYDPLDLAFLYPYPNNHLLRRRGQVDPTAPDYVQFPKYESISGKLAILNPGDILVFPTRAPHYTDTLETSLSLVLRWN